MTDRKGGEGTTKSTEGSKGTTDFTDDHGWERIQLATDYTDESDFLFNNASLDPASPEQDRCREQEKTERGFSNPLFLVMGDPPPGVAGRNVPPPLINLRSSASSAVPSFAWRSWRALREANKSVVRDHPRNPWLNHQVSRIRYPASKNILRLLCFLWFLLPLPFKVSFPWLRS